MILVTLGTQDKDFSRLIKAVEQYVIKNKIKEKVIVQAGHTKYNSEYLEILDFVDMNKFNELIGNCSILITHGGVGSILAGINNGKKVIAAARLKKYKEHTNDHQKQIIKELVKDEYIVELKNFNKLELAIKDVKKLKVKKYVSNTNNMINLIESYIDKS